MREINLKVNPFSERLMNPLCSSLNYLLRQPYWKKKPMIRISAASALKTRPSQRTARSVSRLTGLACVLFGILLPNTRVTAETSSLESQYNNHLTCAVYYRMVAGSFKRSGNGILAEPALDRMTIMIEKAKQMSEALGNDEADYLSDWSDTLNLLTDQMNRNYKNIRQLKARYQNRCTALED